MDIITVAVHKATKQLDCSRETFLANFFSANLGKEDINEDYRF